MQLVGSLTFRGHAIARFLTRTASMRGVKSEAMVMCATSPDGNTVEFLRPPEGSQPGDRVFFEGFEGMSQRISCGVARGHAPLRACGAVVRWDRLLQAPRILSSTPRKRFVHMNHDVMHGPVRPMLTRHPARRRCRGGATDL